MNTKDNFSEIAGNCATWRQEYLPELSRYLSSLSTKNNKALDCRTDNGQAAKLPAKNNQEVYATDISEAQLKHVVVISNIYNSVGGQKKWIFLISILIWYVRPVHWFNHELYDICSVCSEGRVRSIAGAFERDLTAVKKFLQFFNNWRLFML